jgi:peptide/nickel transport system permease protein
MASRREIRVLGMTPGEIWRGFIATVTGKAAVAFFAVMIAFSIYAAVSLPPNFGSLWNTPSYWQANPKLAPPAWVNAFIGNVYAPQLVIKDFSYSEGPNYVVATFTVNFNYEEPWRELYLIVENPAVYNTTSAPLAYITVQRPDGKTLQLGPISINREFITVGALPQISSEVLSFYQGLGYSGPLPASSSAIPNLFYAVESGRLVPLDGTYKFTVTIYLLSPSIKLNKDQIAFVLEGGAYGLMGTDFMGRDLWQGLLAGFPIDLAVGLVTALIVVTIAVLIGIMAGFYGGIADEVLTRVTDFFILLPAFPLLIVFSVLFQWSIWDAVAFLALVSWGGSARIIRSMVMQIRSSQFIDLATAAGAGRFWILRNHILPMVMPYTLYLLVVNVPGGILTLSALNFFNLAGAQLPTWGNILAYANELGALTSGYWWWVVPPGLLIAFTAVTFILVAMGLEPVVNPRLRHA